MSEFNSVDEFLQEADLSEKLGSGAERKGKFIAIYGSTEGNSPQGTLSTDLVEEHGLDKFDRVRFAGNIEEDEIHAFFFTEDFLEGRDDIEDEGISLSPSGTNIDFSGPSILKHLDLEPPVRFRVNDEGDSNGEAIRTGGCVLLSLYEAEF